MGQNAVASGAGAVAVQTAGDNNVITVFARGSRMVLDRPHKRQRAPTTELELLRTDIRATRLVGRDTELVALSAWLAQDAAVAVRCLIGRAGSGKSRLAIELCAQAEADGWIAGFVDRDELVRYHAQMNLSASQPTQPTLVVVDDAATAGSILKDWFAALARQGPDAGAAKLRILMLERHADASFGWWAELRRVDDMTRAGAAALIGEEQPVALSVLAAETDRRALLGDALALAAGLKALPVPQLPATGANPPFDALLANDSRLENEPLFLLMAAIVGVERGAAGALALGKPELARHMAATERQRLVRLAEARGLGDHADALLHAAACITLQRGITGQALMALLKEEAAAMAFGAPSAAMAKLLREALPAKGDIVDGIRPDLIGGAFLVETVAGEWPRSEQDSQAIVARAAARAMLPVVETLVLAAQDLAEGKADHSAVQWLLAIARSEADGARLAQIVESLPQASLALREVTAELYGILTGFFRAEGDLPALAGSLNNLANRQSALGQRETAMATAQEAVLLCRQLVEARPDLFQPALAMSLNNLANRQGNLGQRKAALVTVLEAVTLYRHLSANRPDAFRPDLAMSLANLANRQRDLGQREGALETAAQAVTLYRHLSADRPDAFRPRLAGSLHNLANCQSELGQREAARATAEEAVRLYRHLAAAQPDAFRPDLAMSLTTLANRQSDCGGREVALEAAQEAVTLYRNLAADRPDAFLPALAGSLNNLANCESSLGHREAALATAEESVKLRQQLATARPDAFLPDLALSLTNLANRQGDLKKWEQALVTAKEAVRLYRHLADTQPDAFRPNLAASLINLGGVLSALTQREAALATAEEAVGLYRHLTAAQPDAFRPYLAASLTNLAVFQNALSQREAALAIAEEAVELRRQLAADKPDAFLPGLARSISVMATILEACDQMADACARDAEAVAVLAGPFLSLPAAHAGLMLSLAKDCLRRHEAAGLEPDPALLNPIIKVLNKLA